MSERLQALGGTEVDFDAFVRTSVPTLTCLATLLVRDRHAVEDAVQATYERVLRHWPRVARDGPPVGYARKVLANLIVDQQRFSLRHPRGPWPDVDPHDAGGLAGVEARMDVLNALQALPARRRAVVVLRVYCDMSERDVAATLGLSAGAVKSALSRGLVQLRELLADEVAHD